MVSMGSIENIEKIENIENIENSKARDPFGSKNDSNYHIGSYNHNIYTPFLARKNIWGSGVLSSALVAPTC